MRSIKILFMFFAVFLVTASISSAEKGELSVSENLLKQADSLFKEHNIDEALEIYLEAVKYARSESDKRILTEAFSQAARCYLKSDRKEEGRTWLQKAKEIASKDDPLGWSRYLGVRGRFEWKDAAETTGLLSPETDRASNTFKEMYDYCLRHDLYERAIDAANMVSITARKNERVNWALKGIDAAEKGNIESWFAPLWNNLGWAYDDIGEYEKSLKALEKARIYHYKRGKELPMLIADWSVGHALRMTGQIDSAETLLRRIQRLAFIRKGEEKSPENAEWVGFSNLELAEIMMIKGDMDKAKSLFKSAFSNLHEANMNEWDPKKLEEIRQRIKDASGKK